MVFFVLGLVCYEIMVVCLCFMGLMGRIVYGILDDLVMRVVDVILKERRRLILVLWDILYSLLYINNMKSFIEMGMIICFVSLFFYSCFIDFEVFVVMVVDCVLDFVGFDFDIYCWGEE